NANAHLNAVSAFRFWANFFSSRGGIFSTGNAAANAGPSSGSHSAQPASSRALSTTSDGFSTFAALSSQTPTPTASSLTKSNRRRRTPSAVTSAAGFPFSGGGAGGQPRKTFSVNAAFHSAARPFHHSRATSATSGSSGRAGLRNDS